MRGVIPAILSKCKELFKRDARLKYMSQSCEKHTVLPGDIKVFNCFYAGNFRSAKGITDCVLRDTPLEPSS